MNGAKINFGQPFASRPTALKGWFQYAPVNVTHVGDNLPADAVVEKGDPDVCSIYIAMSKKQYTIDNTKMAELRSILRMMRTLSPMVRCLCRNA